MTEELFREDATLHECTARVLAVDEQGVRLDRTVFYPQGGGQAGDAGVLRLPDGRELEVADTRKGAQPGEILHVLADAGDAAALQPGSERHGRHRPRAPRRAHALSHRHAPAVRAGAAPGGRLLDHRNVCAARFPHERAAGQAGADRRHRAPGGRGAPRCGHRWISEAELDANPQLVRSMSVMPPRGQGRIRVLEIEGVDLQPCGGTHVANTAEIGAVVVTKVEKKISDDPQGRPRLCRGRAVTPISGHCRKKKARRSGPACSR